MVLGDGLSYIAGGSSSTSSSARGSGVFSLTGSGDGVDSRAISGLGSYSDELLEDLRGLSIVSSISCSLNDSSSYSEGSISASCGLTIVGFCFAMNASIDLPQTKSEITMSLKKL